MSTVVISETRFVFSSFNKSQPVYKELVNEMHRSFIAANNGDKRVNLIWSHVELAGNEVAEHHAREPDNHKSSKSSGKFPKSIDK